MTTTDRGNSGGSATVEGRAREAADTPLTAAQREALEFLRNPCATATKILVGDPATGKTTLLGRLAAESRDYTVLRVSGGLDADFMTSLLQAAGFNPSKLSRGVRENLLTVFLEHQKSIGRRTVILIDEADRLDAEDWTDVERLHILQGEERADFSLVLAGRPKLYERLHSPRGKWHRARTRVHMLRPAGKPRRGEDPPAVPHLIVTQYGEVIDNALLKARTLIGRSPHNDVCLKHPSVSRHHAVVTRTPRGYYVSDLRSKNGLKVNGQRIASAMLKNDDIVILGPYRLKLAAGTQPLQEQTPREPPLADTATMRVKALRRRLEGSLLAGVTTAGS